MITNQKCNSCAFASKCLAKSKLKPFSDEAKQDLRVTLEFKSCSDYKKAEETKED